MYSITAFPLAKERISACSLSRKLEGFSLVELLVAAVILALSVAGTAAGFNLITSSLGKSAGYNETQLSIDSDISKIKQMARLYTPCSNPLGAVPEKFPYCGFESTGDIASAYYFPVDPDDIDAFSQACKAAEGSGHFADKLIDEIKKLDGLPESITREVSRQKPGEPLDHSIEIIYNSPQLVYERKLVIAPVASAWCP